MFQVHHVVPGPNRGLFRIGSKIDALGNVTGGMWVCRHRE